MYHQYNENLGVFFLKNLPESKAGLFLAAANALMDACTEKTMQYKYDVILDTRMDDEGVVVRDVNVIGAVLYFYRDVIDNNPSVKTMDDVIASFPYFVCKKLTVIYNSVYGDDIEDDIHAIKRKYDGFDEELEMLDPLKFIMNPLQVARYLKAVAAYYKEREL